MDVAAKQHRIAHRRLAQCSDQAVARGGVAIPDIGPARIASARQGQPRDHRRLTDQAPTGARVRQAIAQPRLLFEPEHGRHRIEDLRAVRDHLPAASTRLRRAELAAVENREAG